MAAHYWVRAKRALARSDPVLARIIREHPRIALEPRGEPFHTLARSIVGQQISVKAADAIWKRFVTASGVVPGRAFPRLAPASVAAIELAALRVCGLSQRKA